MMLLASCQVATTIGQSCGIDDSYDEAKSATCLQNIFLNKDQAYFSKLLEEPYGFRATCDYPNSLSLTISKFDEINIAKQLTEECHYSPVELNQALKAAVFESNRIKPIDSELELIELICVAGADPNVEDSIPILLARKVSVLKILKKFGGDLGAQAPDGQTNLHDAVYLADFDRVKYLVQVDSSLRLIKDGLGKTALDWARERHHKNPSAKTYQIYQLLEGE